MGNTRENLCGGRFVSVDYYRLLTIDKIVIGPLEEVAIQVSGFKLLKE